MEESTVDLINSGINIFSADSSSSITANNSLYSEGNSLTSGNPIPGGGINPFAGDGGSQLQQLIFDRLKLVLGENFFEDTDNALAGGVNPFAGNGSPIVGGGTNPFAGNGNPIVDAESLLQRSPFDPLREVLGNNIPFSNGGNTSNFGSNPVNSADNPPFNAGNAPVGNNNKNFGSDNATIGNFNIDYGSNSATIGNGNWNFNDENATIGNGNWLFGKGNTTLGNGNWYWDNGSDNSTLGNGNWHFDSNNTTLGNGNWNFGSDNATIGNGNWDFGTNNTIVGNGNWVFTNGNSIIGNGKWLVDSDNTTTSLELSSQDIKADVNNLIDSLVGRIGQDFLVLTEDLDVSSTQTFNRLISSRSVDIDDTNISNDIEQLLASLSVIQGNPNYLPVPNSQSVPEAGSSVSLVVMGFVCLVLSMFKKLQHS